MYNLIINGMSPNDWSSSVFELTRERIFEYTDPKIQEDYKNNLEFLQKFPCLFVYEAQEAKKIIGRIGKVEKIIKKYSKMIIHYQADDGYELVVINTKNQNELTLLGIDNPHELNRHHWAVKNVDLFEYAYRLSSWKTIKRRPSVTSGDKRKIWGENYDKKIRIFFSHKVEHKENVTKIKEELVNKGYKCFVAHQDIEPSLDWKDTIIKALESANIFVGFLTDDFHTGNWTDQEIGYIFGRDNVKRLFLKFGESDPQGFPSSEQAIATNWENASKNILDFVQRNNIDQITQ